jgi:hypothetical protein
MPDWLLKPYAIGRSKGGIRIIVLAWKAAVVLSFIFFINWLALVTEYWLMLILLYTCMGLVVRTLFGRMIPTHSNGHPIEPIRSRGDYIAVSIIDFCNQYAFPLLWPFILLLVTLNPFRVEE